MKRCLTLIAVAAAWALVPVSTAASADGRDLARGPSGDGGNQSLRVVLLGLRSDERGLTRFVRRVSRPGSRRYGRYLNPRKLRHRYGAARGVRRRVLNFLRSQDGVERVRLGSTGAVALAVVEAGAAQTLFCATGSNPPGEDVCVPRALRRVVRQVSVGEIYQAGNASRAASAGAAAAERTGTPRGCKAGVDSGSFTPNQIDTAYGTDKLNARGLKGQGMQVAILSSAFVDESAFATWAGCFGLPTPRFEQTPMPGASIDTSTDPDETYLDVEALAAVAPKLRRITAIFVPLDDSFVNSFPLFLYGALDRGRLGQLPDVLSISDAVCESLFSPDELRISERLLRRAAALGITAISASGDLGFLGCNSGSSGASFPASSRYVTGVGGTDFTLTTQNQIADQVVWSTFGADPDQGGGTGGGPSSVWRRPGFQTARGIDGSLQPGARSRLTPDIASMGSFTPGIVTFGGFGGWTGGGGTSAATPLAAALIALVNQQEVAAGRSELGALNPALYRLARGRHYDSIFWDVVNGTSSPHPNTPLGRSPAGGAAQRGFDLATGLGSLRGPRFAAAVAASR
ncbi:MAG: S53 family peptidase [Solirubrobacterales bacterium]